MDINWEALGKRLIGLNMIGFRIEQDSGHRWIIKDENADFVPICLRGEEFNCTKEYGSYVAALDRIDSILTANGQSTLLEQFDGVNHYDDLGVVFGEGTQ